jgi:hypothetical protein
MNHHDEEIMILELFRKSYPEFPKGKLLKSESPDFILRQNYHQSIGIEITKLREANIPKSNPGFPVAELNYANIGAAIRSKEEKLALYRQKKINIFWLLITVDYIRLSEAMNSSNIIAGWEFNTGYHKVFLFDLFEKKIFELNTK